MRRGRLVALALAVAACVDPAGPEDRFAQLSLRASFAAGESPADFGVAVESMQVRIERPDQTAPLVDTVVAYVEGEAASWVIDLLADEEQLSVDVSLLGGAALLYQGQATVTARSGEVGQAEVLGVPVIYRGPPATDSVAVTPAGASVGAVGDRVQLAATALARDGSVLADKSFTWQSSDPAVAVVDAQGMVEAIAEGQATVSATVDGVSGSAAITVQPVAAPATSTIEAAPGPVPADGLSPVAITVRLFDANGHPLTTSRGSIVLSTSLGTLADLTDHNDGTWSATLTSLAVGTAAVTGLLDGAPIADTATVTFVAGPASPLTSTITADPPRTRIGGKGTAIRVRLFDAQGNRLTGSGGTVTLATTLGMLGAVEDRGDGSYRATLQSGVVGRALVTGSVNGVPMTAAVEVRFVD